MKKNNVRKCEVENCDRKHLAKKMCKKHYREMKVHGECSTWEKNEYETCMDVTLMYIRNRNREITCAAYFDTEDLPLVKKYKWCFNSGYVVSTSLPNKTIYLHKLVMGEAFTKQMIDHINVNSLDNMKINLRKCQHRENLRNRKMVKSNSCGYKGVVLNKNSKKNPFIASICVEYKRHYLGSFKTAVEAFKAYCLASKKYHGSFGRTI